MSAPLASRIVLVATLVAVPALGVPALARRGATGSLHSARILLLVLRRRRRGCVDVIELPRHVAPLPPVISGPTDDPTAW